MTPGRDPRPYMIVPLPVLRKDRKDALEFDRSTDVDFQPRECWSQVVIIKEWRKPQPSRGGDDPDE